MLAMSRVPQVVIVGAGFGGLKAAKRLGHEAVRLTVIDRSNHHLFQPLLYQVATASLSPADIASPIRSVLREQKNTEVLLGEVKGVDADRKVVLIEGREVPYDYLILAPGARHGYFGHENWEKFAPGIKSIADATSIRQKILLAFEKAEMEPNAVLRKEYLTFVLVGGGPTGVEMAGAIAELAHRALALDFRTIDPRVTRVILLEAGSRVLAGFPESLSLKAQSELERLGVDVRTGSRVEEVSKDEVLVNGTKIRARTIIWAAGVVASPVGKWLGAKTDRAGRVYVEPDLSLAGQSDIFVIGDAAVVMDESGHPLPGVAPVAMQEGSYVANLILKRIAGENEARPFRYWDKGNLATVGRGYAVADLGTLKLTGVMAWWAWIVVHIYYLIGFRNRLLVLFQWAWAFLTFQRGARLITNSAEESAE